MPNDYNNPSSCQYLPRGLPYDYSDTEMPYNYRDTGMRNEFNAAGTPYEYNATGTPYEYNATGMPFEYNATGMPYEYNDTGMPYDYNDASSCQYLLRGLSSDSDSTWQKRAGWQINCYSNIIRTAPQLCQNGKPIVEKRHHPIYRRRGKCSYFFLLTRQALNHYLISFFFAQYAQSTEKIMHSHKNDYCIFWF